MHEIVDYKLVRGVARELLPSLCWYVLTVVLQSYVFVFYASPSTALLCIATLFCLAHFSRSGLGIDGPDAQKVCASLTAEREDVRVRREELRKKLERLEAASQELAAYR